MIIIPDKSPVARRRDGAAAALRGVGLRLTGPRRRVLEVVRGSDAHPTAEAEHQMVQRRLPRVSLRTVYRNLRLLVAQGLVKELSGPHTRFDCNLSEHPLHLSGLRAHRRRGRAAHRAQLAPW